MRKRPLIFLFIPILLMAIVVSIPMQIIFSTELTAINWHILINQLSIFNWLVIMISFTTSVYTFYGDRNLLFALPVLLAAIVVNNYYVFLYGINVHWAGPILSSLVAIGFYVTLLFNKKLRFITNHQEKRWWLIPKRTQKTLPIWIIVDSEKCLLARTHDLSKTGAFVSSIAGVQSFIEKKLNVGEQVKIVIGDKDHIEFECQASIVRKTEARGNYPRGIGLHFDKVALKDRFSLNRLLNNDCYQSL